MPNAIQKRFFKKALLNDKGVKMIIDLPAEIEQVIISQESIRFNGG